MDNLVLSLNVVLPLFLMIVLGYALKAVKLFDAHTVSQMNTVVFKVFLPLLLFINVYQTDIQGVFNVKLLLFSVASVLTIFALVFLIVVLVEKDNRKRGVLIQAMFRSNFVIFGIPVTTALFGTEAVGATAMVVAVVVPLFNVLAVITLETFRGSKINVKKIIKGIITNHMILGTLIGMLFLVTGLQLPAVLEKTIVDLSKVTTPLALVILGASFTFSSVRGNVLNVCIGVIGKLIISPLIFLSIAIALGFRGVDLGILLAVFGAPTAVASFSMAKQMDGDADLAGQLVVFSSMLSVITMFGWIFLLKQGQWF